MADDAGEPGPAGRFPPKQPGPPRADAPVPPPRPPISKASPAPIRPAVPPPSAIIASRSLWVTSFVVGFLAIGVAFLARAGQMDELQDLIDDLMPDENESTLERAAAVVYWACIGALVGVIVVESLLLRLVMNRRRGVRWFLLAFVAIHAGVAIVADAFLSLGDAGAYLRLLLGAQLVLALIASVVSILPGTRRWFRVED
jgi:hypothetical protein